MDRRHPGPRAAGRPRCVALVVGLVLAVVPACRGERKSNPLRRPVAEREYREVEALEWKVGAEPGELKPYLSSAWPKVRARAAVAYARLHRGKDPGPLLERWSVEDDASTRAGLVYALRAFDRSKIIEVLESAGDDEEVMVRRAVATALGDVGDCRDLGQKLAQDDDPGVRRRALLSLAFRQQAAAAFWSDRLKAESDQSVRWALYAGATLEPQLGSELETDLARVIADRNFLVGVFAFEALARLERARDSSASEPPLSLAATLEIAGSRGTFWLQREAALRFVTARLLQDESLKGGERQKIEAFLLALDQSPIDPPVLRYRLLRSLCTVRNAAVVPRLAELAGASDPAVRLALADGLADVLAAGKPVLRPSAGDNGSERTAALTGLLGGLSTDRYGRVRAAAARIADSDGQVTWALTDPSPGVRAAALKTVSTASPAILSTALRDPAEPVRRAALVRALRDRTPLDVDALRSAALDSTRWRWGARLWALDLLCERQPDLSHEVLGRAVRDPDPVVVRHALRLAGKLGATELRGVEAGRGVLVPGFPLIDRDAAASRRRPRVVVEVEGKQPFVLELYAEEAPLHASSFLALARGGAYLGQQVAQIDVPNGVRFDLGEGQDSMRLGQPLWPEDSQLPFARGSLVSLPVYDRDGERWNAVGQWHITLLPRPDLRGRGTCWGRVYIGMRVVDRLVPGDRIVSVEVVD